MAQIITKSVSILSESSDRKICPKIGLPPTLSLFLFQAAVGSQSLSVDSARDSKDESFLLLLSKEKSCLASPPVCRGHAATC
jgi:hypothetical protein